METSSMCWYIHVLWMRVSVPLDDPRFRLPGDLKGGGAEWGDCVSPSLRGSPHLGCSCLAGVGGGVRDKQASVPEPEIPYLWLMTASYSGPWTSK